LVSRNLVRARRDTVRRILKSTAPHPVKPHEELLSALLRWSTTKPRCFRSAFGAKRTWAAASSRTAPWRRRPLLSVGGFFAAVVRKKLALRLESEKTDGERLYRIVAGKVSANAADQPNA
jgi:hypothetical protein